MNTSRPSPFPPASAARPMHRSVRTAISENMDATTGQRTQVLRTSELTMTWVGDDLQMKYRASAMTLNVDRARARRGLRGGLGG